MCEITDFTLTYFLLQVMYFVDQLNKVPQTLTALTNQFYLFCLLEIPFSLYQVLV